MDGPAERQQHAFRRASVASSGSPTRPLAESVSTSYTGNWQVFKWQETLEALLDVRAAIGPLVDGRVCIEIIGYGTLTLEVHNGATRCEKTEEKPAISVDSPTAHRLFFGPHSALCRGGANTRLGRARSVVSSPSIFG